MNIDDLLQGETIRFISRLIIEAVGSIFSGINSLFESIAREAPDSVIKAFGYVMAFLPLIFAICWIVRKNNHHFIRSYSSIMGRVIATFIELAFTMLVLLIFYAIVFNSIGQSVRDLSALVFVSTCFMLGVIVVESDVPPVSHPAKTGIRRFPSSM